MTYDLRHEPWIPWRRRSGAVEWGPPAMLVDRIDDDPVVGLAAPRPDFDGAMQEFLIGLLTVALQPAGESEWRRLWEAPPSREQLQAALDALPPAFDLDGDGPRFFQDSSMADCQSGEEWAVEALLIDTAGTTTKEAARREIRTDLFMKPGRVSRLSRPASAMALLTMQTYAPEGGRGHLTSMRGGGPLTTLVDPRVDEAGRPRAHDQALWRALWANVETTSQLAERAPGGAPSTPSAVFPWLGSTRAASDSGTRMTTPSDVHPAQAYFGLPRRIRLNFSGAGRCDLTGLDDDTTVTSFWMRGPGTKYVDWQHPLSPYRNAKGKWFPVHGKAEGLVWRDWLGLTLVDAPAGDRQPAATVARFEWRMRSESQRRFRVHAFGYDMEHKKSVAWTEALLPAFVVDERRQALVYSTAFGLADATGMAAATLLGAVKTALFQKPKEARGDLGQVRLDLWAATERAFYTTISAIVAPALSADAAEDLAMEQRRTFAPVLRDRAIEVFDRWCPAAGLAPEVLRRRVTARYNLVTTLRGYSNFGEKLFESLGIAAPGGGKAARKAARTRSRKEATT